MCQWVRVQDNIYVNEDAGRGERGPDDTLTIQDGIIDLHQTARVEFTRIYEFNRPYIVAHLYRDIKDSTYDEIRDDAVIRLRAELDTRVQRVARRSAAAIS
jgi:hypothetical protein